MRFTSHASGSSGNCYTVTDGDNVLMIECGIRYREIQIATAFGISALAGLLVSHAHGDHSRAIREMLGAGVDCYLSLGCAQALGVSGHHRCRIVRSRHAFQVGAFEVVPFDLVHDAAETLGFQVDGPSGRRLVFVSDTAYSPYRFEGVHIFAVEANFSREIIKEKAVAGHIDMGRARRTEQNHMSLETLLKFFKANDLSQCEEIHLLHLSDSNSDEREFKKAVERATGIPTYIAGSEMEAPY